MKGLHELSAESHQLALRLQGRFEQGIETRVSHVGFAPAAIKPLLEEGYITHKHGLIELTCWGRFQLGLPIVDFIDQELKDLDDSYNYGSHGSKERHILADRIKATKGLRA